MKTMKSFKVLFDEVAGSRGQGHLADLAVEEWEEIVPAARKYMMIHANVGELRSIVATGEIQIDEKPSTTTPPAA